jgi:hypothetical protein
MVSNSLFYPLKTGLLCTQLRLKQSCEQKTLSFPIFWQVGHCSEVASFSQSLPKHLRGVVVVAMVK